MESEGLDSPPPVNRVWEFWPTTGFGLAIFTVYFVTQFRAAVIYAFICGFIDSISSSEVFVEDNFIDIVAFGDMLSVITIISTIVGMAFIIFFVKFRKGPSFSEYVGLRAVSKVSIIVVLILTAIIIALFLVLFRNLIEPENPGFTIEVYQDSAWPVLFGIAVVLFAPVFEEFYFRGFLFVGFRQSNLRTVGAILLTSFGWALLHVQYSLPGIAMIFGFGIVLGIVRIRTGSLWSTLFLHALWNLTAVISTVSYVNGID